MPRVKPLGDSAKRKARWDAANANFNRQVGRLLGETGMTGEELSSLIGVDRTTLARWRKDCSAMSIAYERRLIEIFEKMKVPYDRTLGEAS